MKKIENFNLVELDFNELLHVNGGVAPAQGSYTLGHFIGSFINNAASLALLSFGMFN